MKKWLVRATVCPECGQPVCRLFQRVVLSPLGQLGNCPCCGCGYRLHTPIWVEVVMVLAGLFLSGICGRIGVHHYKLMAGCFLMGYFGTGLLLMPLYPPGLNEQMERAVRGRADLKKSYGCPAEQLFWAACAALQKTRGFCVTEKDAQQGILYVKKERDIAFTQEECSWEWICLRISPGDRGGAEVRISLEDSDSWDYDERRAVMLDQICRTIDAELAQPSQPVGQ